MDSFDLLHRLFGRMYRSLLQYVGESWPWSPAQKETAEHAFLHELLAAQMVDVRDLADFLVAHRVPLFPDQYPVKFTDLQYLSLEHLVREVLADQQELLGDLDAGAKALATFPEAAELVKSIAESERKLVERLKSFVNAPATAGV